MTRTWRCNRDEERQQANALVDSIRQGDIMIVNACYPGVHTSFVKILYFDASQPAQTSKRETAR
jgi:hypothetical protein